MKHQTYEMKRALENLANAASGITLSPTQATDIISTIEDFLWEIAPSIAETKDDSNTAYRMHMTRKILDQVKSTIGDPPAKTVDAFDEAMRSITKAADHKWTNHGLKE